VDQAGPARKEPLLNSWLLLFLFAMILANIGGAMYDPILPLYLQQLDASISDVGWFFTLSRILPLAMLILGGYISDSLGRLRSIAMGSIAGVFTYVALILAPTWQWVLLASMFSAITSALIMPSFPAFIAEHSTESNRARVFGISETLFIVVLVVGPPLGGWLAQSYGFKQMFIVAGGFYLVATIIRVGMAREAAKGKEGNPQKPSLAGLKVNLSAMMLLITAGGIVTWILITDGVRDVAFSLSGNLFPIFGRDIIGLSISQIGWMSSFFGISMMLINFPAGWLSDKVGERVPIVLGFFLQAVAVGMIVLVPNLSVVSTSVAWIIAGAGVGLMSPAYQSLISKAVPQKIRGTAFGLFSSSLGVISMPAPAIGAWMWETIGPRAPFAITALASLLAMIPAWFKFKIEKPVEEPGPTEPVPLPVSPVETFAAAGDVLQDD
jgi:MFS family permease